MRPDIVDEVNRLYLSTIETLATAIDAKDQVPTVIFVGFSDTRWPSQELG